MKTHVPKPFDSAQPNKKTKGASLAPPPFQRKENKTGMPDQLKSGIESLSGIDMSDVKVHFNSSQPAQLQAHAFAQGNQIHLEPGQEKHLPHEAWHVVQQKQGRVKPTKQLKGKVSINDDVGLEKEADMMGGKAMINENSDKDESTMSPTYQLMPLTLNVSTQTPLQLNQNGRWWGSTLGGLAGGFGGALASAVAFPVTATAAAVGGTVGGITGAAKGLYNEGIIGAVKGGVSGGVSGAVSAGMMGVRIGSTLGSALGGSLADLATGQEEQTIKDIAASMLANLNALDAQQKHELEPNLSHHEKMTSEIQEKMDKNEVMLLNWMHRGLGDKNFEEVTKGGQVRVPFNQEVFQALIKLGAQRRQSSHYAGLVFASGFRQVIDEQYGTKGHFLPTVLFGKIYDRAAPPNYFMYFQPEGNAFNPDTNLIEKAGHVLDAGLYVLLGEQQGPHGKSRRTDADPITGSHEKYVPTASDKYGWARAGDLAAFAQNLYHNSVKEEIRNKIGGKVNTGIEILESMGAINFAHKVWAKFNGKKNN